MRKAIALLAAATLAAMPLIGADKDKEEDRLMDCGTAMHEILNVPDNIPQNLLDKAECVIVIPNLLKVAFVGGGAYGRGAMTCRTGPRFDGPWGPPTMMIMEGASVGFQLGAQATDFVLLVMNDRGARSLLENKVKLGVDAAAAAGPKGRDAAASTDAAMRAEVLSYSRSRGVFAGVSVDGASLRPDEDGNARLYGKMVRARDLVLFNSMPPPAAAKDLLDTLNQHSPRNQSAGKPN
jgi:lipid-binding SYLF domain-containing protein